MTAFEASTTLPTRTGRPTVRSLGFAGSMPGAANCRSHRQSSAMRTMAVSAGGTNAPFTSAKASPARTTTSSPPCPSGVPAMARVVGGARALREHLPGGRLVELILAGRGRVELRERARHVDDAAARQRGGDAAVQPPCRRRRHIGAHTGGRHRQGQGQRRDRGARQPAGLRLPHSTLVPRPPPAPRA